MYIFLISIFGLFLRLINIIKPEGLWNDEYVSWFTASVPFGDGFLSAVLKQCHMPLYYLYLKPFVGYSDTILRLTSVIPSVLAIPVMYLAGKEFSNKCGYYAAVITSILPFLIYYSQEVRFYSLVFLISAAVLLFLLRTVKNDKRHNLVLFAIFSLILIFTHVLGIFFILPCVLYLIYKKNFLKTKAIIFITIAFFAILPIGLHIIKQLPSAQWWGIFSYTNILFLFSDFLSPVLSNNINAPQEFFCNKDLLFNLLLAIPSLLGISAIVCGIGKHKGLITICLIFTSVIAVLSFSGVLVFITKYLTEILPVLILVMSTGFLEIKPKGFGIFLFAAYITISLAALFTPHYPSVQLRSEGHRIPAMVLNKHKPDIVIYTYYAPDRFDRYADNIPEKRHISKINRFEYKDNPEKIFNKNDSGKNISVVFLDSVSFIPEDILEEAEKKQMPEMYITFSSIRHKMIKYMKANCESVVFIKSGSWTILSCKNFK